jgi:hypothetical protein
VDDGDGLDGVGRVVVAELWPRARRSRLMARITWSGMFTGPGRDEQVGAARGVHVVRHVAAAAVSNTSTFSEALANLGDAGTYNRDEDAPVCSVTARREMEEAKCGWGEDEDAI